MKTYSPLALRPPPNGQGPNSSPNPILMKRLFLAVLALTAFILADARSKPKFDYSLVFVPEEGGVRFQKITDDADRVADYCYKADDHGKNGNLVGKSQSKSRKTSTLDWWILPQIALSPDGTRLGYINEKNGTTNIMIKSATTGGASTQRTFRSNVQGFTWSPDGKELCFTELRGGHQGVYLVSAEQGTIVKQISNGTENDYCGVIQGNIIYFHRGEGASNFSLWSYDRTTNLFSNYSRGMTACPIPGDDNTVFCARFTDMGESEIWRVNFVTGVEELILGQPGKSYTSPNLSPDGKWLLVVSNSCTEKEKIDNTDIFVVRTDGTHLTQLTYHAGNDLSPVWSPDGKSIYFLSQRGSADRIYNVWKMDFTL